MKVAIPVDGGALHGEVVGAGDAVVLLHAGPVDSRVWDRVLADLAATHRVVRYDARGSGRSSQPRAPFSFVDDLVAVLDYLGIARAVLVGQSLGGMVTIDAALAHPERVGGLVLVGAGRSGDPWPEIPQLAALDEALEAGDVERATAIRLDLWAPLRSDLEADALIERMVRDKLALQRQPRTPPREGWLPSGAWRRSRCRRSWWWARPTTP
jgi:3-oxoadipate enol-lactonase